MARAQLSYFSDVLCIWAYAAQVRLDELRDQFGDDIQVTHHFISVFGNTGERIGQGWQDRGGFDGFADHVREVAAGFPHITIHDSLWRDTQPTSSGPAHLLLKAAQRITDRETFEALLWRVRHAFFAEGQDISRTDLLLDLVEDESMKGQIRSAMDDGTAMAALLSDLELKATHGLQGSPTYFLNDRRQILYGNIGYRIIEANVQELLRGEASGDSASWC